MHILRILAVRKPLLPANDVAEAGHTFEMSWKLGTMRRGYNATTKEHSQGYYPLLRRCNTTHIHDRHHILHYVDEILLESSIHSPMPAYDV